MDTSSVGLATKVRITYAEITQSIHLKTQSSTTIEKICTSAAENKLLPALMRVLPALNQAERAVEPFAIAVAASAFQAIDDAIGLTRRAVELVAQLRSRINTLGDQ